ncbi:MAG: hypothetical protein R3B70_17775 [Polyangiaceae bacterium]
MPIERPTIVAPHSTNGSNQIVTTIGATRAGATTTPVTLYLMTTSPADVGRWTCTTEGVTASFQGSGNPYLLCQSVTFANVPSLVDSIGVAVLSTSGSTIASAQIQLAQSAVAMRTAGPVVPAGGQVKLVVGSEGERLSFDATGWSTDNSGVRISVQTDPREATLTIPATLAAGSTVTVTVTDTSGTFSGVTRVYVAPASANDTNTVYTYNQDGGLYLGLTGDWTPRSGTGQNTPASSQFGFSDLPWPAFRILERGEYVTNLAGPGNEVAIGGVSCYVMNVNVFGALAGMPKSQGT